MIYLRYMAQTRGPLSPVRVYIDCGSEGWPALELIELFPDSVPTATIANADLIVAEQSSGWLRAHYLHLIRSMQSGAKLWWYNPQSGRIKVYSRRELAAMPFQMHMDRVAFRLWRWSSLRRQHRWEQ